jgi:NAD(P)-dependent dehydrogenase (short-subunit alcohol dehydrogenase family)
MIQGLVADPTFAGRRIRLNTVSPGPIETPAWGNIGHAPDKIAAIKEEIPCATPLRRFEYHRRRSPR